MSPSPHRSTRPMDGRQHGKKVTKSHKPMRTLTKPQAASGTMLLVNLRMTAFGVRGMFQEADQPILADSPKEVLDVGVKYPVHFPRYRNPDAFFYASRLKA